MYEVLGKSSCWPWDHSSPRRSLTAAGITHSQTFYSAYELDGQEDFIGSVAEHYARRGIQEGQETRTSEGVRGRGTGNEENSDGTHRRRVSRPASTTKAIL